MGSTTLLFKCSARRPRPWGHFRSYDSKNAAANRSKWPLHRNSYPSIETSERRFDLFGRLGRDPLRPKIGILR